MEAHNAANKLRGGHINATELFFLASVTALCVLPKLAPLERPWDGDRPYRPEPAFGRDAR